MIVMVEVSSFIANIELQNIKTKTKQKLNKTKTHTKN